MELKRYWEILWRRKGIFLLSILLIPLFTLLLIYAAVPIYKCEAKLKVKINPIETGFFKDMPREIGRFDFFVQVSVMKSYCHRSVTVVKLVPPPKYPFEPAVNVTML